MNRFVSVAMAMLAGAALGAVAVNGLNAQTKPPTYVVIDIAQMTDPEGFKAIPASPAPSAAPKRFVVLAFDSKEKARGWYDAPDIKEINTLRDKTTKSSAFIVEGVAN